MMEFYSASTTRNSTPGNKPVNPQVAYTTSRVSPWLCSLAYPLGRFFVLPMFFGEIEITGQEYLPQSGPVIFAPTHRSRWDSLLLPYATGRHVTGRDMRFMVTSSECQGLQGWFVLRMGGFPVNVERPAIATLRHAVDLLRQEEMLVIYPEGGIFRDGKVHPLKPGIGRLAVNAESSFPGLKIKIVPVAINYSHPYPRWGTNVKINIGEPILAAEYHSGNLKLDAKHLTRDLTNQLQKLSFNVSVVGREIQDFPTSTFEKISIHNHNM
jgi:1-acyl-sn-glycerol-3-phosphate acyltransferase